MVFPGGTTQGEHRFMSTSTDESAAANNRGTFSNDQKGDPIWTLLKLLFKSHPWHGVPIGKEAPAVVTTFMLEAGIRNVPGFSENSVSPVDSDLTSTPHTAFWNAGLPK